MDKNSLKLFLLFWSICLLFSSCQEQAKGVAAERFEAAAENYAEIVSASYQDSYDEAKKLKDLIDTFVANPSEAGFVAAKDQWLKARIPYGQTEAYRFYGGPIDDEDGPEGLINAWPMDENFIDYVVGNPNAGIINNLDAYPEITKQLLVDLNESASEESISTGYHAIEFLLWGQDLFEDSPGKRPYTDYVTDGSGTASHQDRRGKYLTIVADLLLEHLEQVKVEWEKEGDYRTAFLALPKNKIITNVFTSLGELSKGELSGERMFVAVDSKDQENEHSCFADNTVSDIVQNFQGIVNVYMGSYDRVNGSTVKGESYADLAKTTNEEKAQAVKDAIALARKRIDAIPSPFDQAILNDREVILDAVTALEDLSDAFADVELELKKEETLYGSSK
ncbi:MAG: imelysin family protein [Bacteroidota bacterium]